MTIDEIIVRLKSSPLFYMFISSRELFHSNFWYWLYTLNPHEAAKLFNLNVSANDKIKFEREYHQKAPDLKIYADAGLKTPKTKIDLAIFVNGSIKKVIENKIKDFATEGQLKRIQRRFSLSNIADKIHNTPEMSRREPSYLLVSLFRPDVNISEWERLGYDELVDRIKASRFSELPYYQNLINDYCMFVHNLAELAKSLPVNDNYDFAIAHINPLFKQLNGILWEGYQKMRGSHFIANYNATHKINNIETRSEIHNQKVTLTFSISLDTDYRIGVQIESDEYRKFVSRDSKKEVGSFAIVLLNANLFFSDEKTKRHNKKVFNVYGKEFRYQYTKIENNTTQGSLFERINNDFQFVIENIDAIKALMPSANA